MLKTGAILKSTKMKKKKHNPLVYPWIYVSMLAFLPCYFVQYKCEFNKRMKKHYK